MNPSSLVYLGVGVVGLVIIFIVVYFIGQASKPTPRANNERNNNNRQNANNGVNNRNNGNELRRRHPEQNNEELDDEDNDNDDNIDDNERYDDEYIKCLRNKKGKEAKRLLNKALKKKEKAERLLSERNQREAVVDKHQEAENAYLTRLREKEKREEEEEQKLLEEEKKRQEKEEEEYNQWKGLIEVEKEGTAEEEMANNENLIQEFINYIKDKKIVQIEDLAMKFHLHVEDAINRVQSLEKMGRLQVLFDERGKIIYLTDEELDAVAKYVNEKGRVSIKELSRQSNKLISLDQRKDDDEGIEDINLDEGDKEEEEKERKS